MFLFCLSKKKILIFLENSHLNAFKVLFFFGKTREILNKEISDEFCFRYQLFVKVIKRFWDFFFEIFGNANLPLFREGICWWELYLN